MIPLKARKDGKDYKFYVQVQPVQINFILSKRQDLDASLASMETVGMISVANVQGDLEGILDK